MNPPDDRAGAIVSGQPQAGRFHLTATASAALERGIAVPEAGQDLDGEPHNKGVPDIGADER